MASTLSLGLAGTAAATPDDALGDGDSDVDVAQYLDDVDQADQGQGTEPLGDSGAKGDDPAGGDGDPAGGDSPGYIPGSDPTGGDQDNPLGGDPDSEDDDGTCEDDSVVETDQAEYVQGAEITFTASGFLPGEDVDFYVYSTEIYAGRTKADADGRAKLTWTSPSDFAPGTHTVKAVGKESNYVSQTTFLVKPAPVPPATPQAPVPQGPRLANTGVDAGDLAVIATLLVASGVALVWRKKKSLLLE
ncbi:MAG: LPXTG cell wall anchor domain-containing protein [Arcanobacterium sp.]